MVFQYVYEDRIVVGVMRLKTHAINLQTTIKLKGLEPESVYTDKESDRKYYGAELMHFGLPIKASSNASDYYATLWEFVLS